LEPSNHTWVAFLVVGVFLVAIAAFIIVKVLREQKKNKKEKDEEKSLLEK
jgi:large-conductance mechanosensitive channel